MFDYDEFAYFHENAAEAGLPYDHPPVVERRSVDVGGGRRLSALVWGAGEPQIVLCHGGAQNAHTWDTVALALDRPLVAVDLPGHGHSDGPEPGGWSMDSAADDVARVIEELAPNAALVVGMSLGGLTAITLAGRHLQLVRRLALIDITPGVNAQRTAPIVAFVSGPPSFSNLDEIVARTIEFNPTRSTASLRRGVLHNALQRPDGTWVWRYSRFSLAPAPRSRPAKPDTGETEAESDTDAGSYSDLGDRAPDAFEGRSGDTRGTSKTDIDLLLNRDALWSHLERLTVPLMLVRGTRPESVVDDDDQARLLEVQPEARIELVDAGHSVQGDNPVLLAKLLADFVDQGTER